MNRQIAKLACDSKLFYTDKSKADCQELKKILVVLDRVTKVQWNLVINAKQCKWVKVAHDNIQVIRAKAIMNAQEREKLLIFQKKPERWK